MEKEGKGLRWKISFWNIFLSSDNNGEEELVRDSNAHDKKYVCCPGEGGNNDGLIGKISANELWGLWFYFNQGIDSPSWHYPWNWVFSVGAGDDWKIHVF